MKLSENLLNKKNTAVAIGKFDGVHIGHARLLDETVDIAKKAGLSSLAFIISPKGQSMIFPEFRRDELISQRGIDDIYTKNLDQAFMSMSPEQFVDEVLVGKLKCGHVVVGYNFRFSKGRAADAYDLKKLCDIRKIGCTIIDKVSVPYLDESLTASSTNIRESLKSGDVKKAALILGRCFQLTGIVSDGKKIGRTLGFPTANIHTTENIVAIKNAVYKTKAYINGIGYDSITNVGINPTVKTDKSVSIETHLIDFKEDIYGDIITVEFIDKIRDEKKFSSLEALKEQIRKDIKCAREMI